MLKVTGLKYFYDSPQEVAGGSAPGLEKPRQALGAAAMEDGFYLQTCIMLELVRPLRQVGR